jgi:hypothetical protein
VGRGRQRTLLIIALAGERHFIVSSARSAGIIEQEQPKEFQRTAALACAVVWGLCTLSVFGNMLSADRGRWRRVVPAGVGGKRSQGR